VRTRRQLASKYFEHLLKLPQAYYDNETTGKIINRLSRAITEMTGFFQFFANNLLQLLLTIAITIGVLLWYSWPLALLFMLLIPSNLYLTALTSGRWQKYESQKNTHFDTASGRFAEVVGQSRLVKSYRTEQQELARFDKEISEMVGITWNQSIWWHSMNALRGIVFGAIFAGIYGTLFYQTARGVFTVGDMVLLITLVQQVAFPMRNLSFFVDSYQRAVANSKDYVSAMQEAPEKESTTEGIDVPSGAVEFDDVSFGYDNDQTRVLKHISFLLEPGKKLALVGESGGGKTTIANLLMRLYDPDKGAIRIDDVDISEVSRGSLRRKIATVFQDAAIFSGTIRDNVTYAKPGASDKEVAAALKAANADEFVARLTHGLDTEIGERGVKLSGGQKQRIAIARALLKDAPILVLDEATSALDSKAEQQVQKALERLMENRTTLIIAHRLSTIAGVDTIVTLANGKVDEAGSPAELATSGGIYSELLSLQRGANEDVEKQLSRYDIAV
jgi:ATP-binding cassette subfamily B protein